MNPALLKNLLPARLRLKIWPDKTLRPASAAERSCPDDETPNFKARLEDRLALRRELAIQISTALAMHGYTPQSTVHAHISADGLQIREMNNGIFTLTPLAADAERAAFAAYLGTLKPAVDEQRLAEILQSGDMVLNLPTLSRHDQMAALSRSAAIAAS